MMIELHLRLTLDVRRVPFHGISLDPMCIKKETSGNETYAQNFNQFIRRGPKQLHAGHDIAINAASCNVSTSIN